MDEFFRSCVVMGVRPGSSRHEIRMAYRALAREWHPDRIVGDERKRREAEERLRAINRAYRMLTARQTEDNGARAGSRPARPGYDPGSWVQSAAEYGRTAESLEDDHAFYTRALDLHFRGMEAFRAARYREAVSSLMQSVCLVQNNPEAYRTLGRAHQRLRQPAKAVWAYEKALLLEPDCVDSRLELGAALLSIGDEAGARRQCVALERLDGELAAHLRASMEKQP